MDDEIILRNEIKKLEKDLSDYLEILPVLGVSEKEAERIFNFMLDDINVRLKKINELK